jgi:carboxyl-terminal processing protease
MSKRARIALALFAALLTLNLFVGYKVYSAEAKQAEEEDAFEKVGVMMRVIHLIRKDYVDGDKVGYEDLIYNALHGMVNSLDPFSDFMPPEALQDMMEETDGEFGGLGVIVTMRDDYLTVMSPMENTPGARAGLQPGDQIVAIEGASTEGLKIHEAVRELKGKPGTDVTITLHRPGNDQTWDVTITRELIPLVSVNDDRIIEGTKVGYVRVLQFSDPTAVDLERKLKSLVEDRGAESLILDLRNNPGGLLESAVDICSMFLKSGDLVVSTEGRRPSQKVSYNARRRDWSVPRNMHVAILVNGGSASAAEITSGCLRDHGRALLVGEKTFGKGSVQNIIDLPDGSALRLTTAMYYTPSRQVIHKHGIMPDIEVKLSDEEYRQLAMADAAIDGVDEPTKVVDRQLQRAVEALQDYASYEAASKAKAAPPKQTQAMAPAADN